MPFHPAIASLFRVPRWASAWSALMAVTLAMALAGPLRAELGDRLLMLAPRDGEDGDQFGTSVALDETTVLVAADHKDENVTNSGTVYVLDAVTGNTLRKLTAADAAADDYFGFEVAVSGDTALLGAPFRDEAGQDVGAAYVFDVAAGNERWKLTADDGAAGDRFGFSVAIDGSAAVVGAPSANNAGVAYVFDADSGEQRFRLSLDNPVENDGFGASVAIDGNRAIVGAFGDDERGTDAGAAYVFDVTTGSQLRKLVASDGASLDLFGLSVDALGDVVVVGSPGAANEHGVFSGAAYVFDLATGSQLWRFSPEDGDFADHFGWSVAVSGQRVVVGSPDDDDIAEDAGAAYVFDLSTGRQLAKLTATDGELEDEAGWDVDVFQDRALAGAPFGVNDGVISGVAHLFDVSGAPPALQAGDADQDWDFDQLDLVRVQVAAKYLTGQPATWGDGDWDGAPGGAPGDPPQGNGLFDQLDIVAAQLAGLYLSGPYAAAPLDRAPVAVPEPSSWVLTLLGTIALLPTACKVRQALAVQTGLPPSSTPFTGAA